jgi:hypothetical protein
MSNLSKFGIPLDGERLGMLQPKLKYRFRVLFENFGTNQGLRELTASVQSVGRPQIQYEEIEVHSYNSRAYFAGKHQWQGIDVTLRDDINNAVNSAVGAQIQKQMNHFEQIGPVAGSNYKFGMQIHTLDGTSGEALEIWELNGCFLTGVNNDSFDYTESTGMMTVTLSIRYDNAVLLAGPNNNEGNVVGGDPFPNLLTGFTGGSTIG